MNKQTTYQRALEQAKKLQPAVRQIGNSLMFDCASTSQLDAFHHVYLGPNKYNLFIDSRCDCGSPKYTCCCHKTAAFLFYISRLEERLHLGSGIITGLENQKENIDEAFELWQDLLNRYERGCDLIRAIEAGWNIPELTGPFKDRLNITTSPDIQLLSA